MGLQVGSNADVIPIAKTPVRIARATSSSARLIEYHFFIPGESSTGLPCTIIFFGIVSN